MCKFSNYDSELRYAGLLTFFWIGDRGLNWPRIASRSGVTSQPVLVPWKRKLGPWFFLIVTNNLNAREADMWKYVDDTAISEVVDKGRGSCIKQVGDDLTKQARDESQISVKQKEMQRALNYLQK